jgi:hypothetical protein
MPKGESIESLLEPSLRVSRPVAACSRCRSSKIKCTWGISACSACERSGKTSSCTSANEEFARGNERSYVAALENAAEKLQRKIDANRAGSDLSILNNGSRQGKGRKISGSQRREASDVNELVSDFGFLTVNATSRDFHGFTSSMSFAKILLAMAVKRDFSTQAASKLPPRHTVMQSTIHYFDKLFVLLPFFSETEFMSSVSRVYQDAQVSAASALDFWYVRLVLAITHAALSRSHGDEHNQVATQHISAAMQLAERVMQPGSIAGVQALLLLVQYAQLDPERLDSWYLMGMASRLVVDLGLHCELPAEARISPEELNMRRRIFHCVYSLDRSIAMSLSRPFSFTDDSAPGVPFPILNGEDNSSNNTGIFLRSIKPCLHLFDIRRIQSGFYQAIKFASRTEWHTSEASSIMTSVSSDVEKWHASIPSSLPSNHLTLFNLERLYTYILVLAPNQRHTAAAQSDDDKLRLFEHCCRFAEILHPVTFDTTYLSSFTDADFWRANWVARQFIKLMWSDFELLVRRSQEAEAASRCSRALDNVRRFTDVLDIARQRWNNSEVREQFEKESAVLSTRLTNKLHELSPTQIRESYFQPVDQAYQLQQQNFTDPAQFFHHPDGKAYSPGGTRRVYQFLGSGNG